MGTAAQALALVPTAIADAVPDLVARAQAGEVAAFEALYRTHVGRIHGLCLRLTADRSLAEELTQEAFVRAYQKLGLFRGESAFSSWLHRLAVNVVLTDRRARRRRIWHAFLPLDSAQDHVLAAPANDGQPLDVERAIERLPPRARWVFVLHEIEGYAHDEIATIAGMSEGTSKAHLHRARQLLREMLR
ncbi:MAG: sigma-70 family RNA polymerase sigma factor [Acidobacteriota bacterium]